MPPTELTALAARLGLELDEDEELTQEIVKKAITRELGGLQSAKDSKFKHQRQVALTSALDELEAAAATSSPASTELVHIPAAAFSQMIELLQKNAAPPPAPPIVPPRPDPESIMRTHVKATATQASTDFTKKRSVPFATASALIASVFGLREIFNVGEVQVSPALFYPLFGIAAVAIVIGYGLAWKAQGRANHILRALYDPDIQEEALNSIGSDSADYFGDHSPRVFESERDWGNTEWAIAEDAGSFIINRGMYRDSLANVAYIKSDWIGHRSRTLPFQGLLTTIDLEAAGDDATGLALDRLIELKIIEPVIFRRRQGFRLIPWG